MRTGWVVCGRGGVCRREDGCWFRYRLTGDWRNGWWSSWPFSASPPLSLPALCFNIRALAIAVFMQALSYFYPSPLVPSCPPSLPGTRAALRLPANHGPGVEQIGPGVSIAPGGRKPWHQRRMSKSRGAPARHGSGFVGVRRSLASINRVFSSTSIQPVHDRICLSKTEEDAQLMVRFNIPSREHRLGPQNLKYCSAHLNVDGCPLPSNHRCSPVLFPTAGCSRSIAVWTLQGPPVSGVEFGDLKLRLLDPRFFPADMCTTCRKDLPRGLESRFSKSLFGLTVSRSLRTP